MRLYLNKNTGGGRSSHKRACVRAKPNRRSGDQEIRRPTDPEGDAGTADVTSVPLDLLLSC
jgi:hypothetical protein